MTEEFSVLADCLDRDGLMENRQEREDFIETLGKTACRMSNYTGCSRPAPRTQFLLPDLRLTCKYIADIM